jgi:hypothetical protein
MPKHQHQHVDPDTRPDAQTVIIRLLIADSWLPFPELCRRVRKQGVIVSNTFIASNMHNVRCFLKVLAAAGHLQPQFLKRLQPLRRLTSHQMVKGSPDKFMEWIKRSL